MCIRDRPRPADYLLLYLINFYVFLLVLKMDYKLAFLGSIFFAFSTYLIIIIGAGHNSKAHAIAYMPLVLAGIILVFNKSYYKGFFITTLALGLEICANHFQMTYYLMFIVVLLGLYFLINFYKRKLLQEYFKSLGILFSALFLSIRDLVTRNIKTEHNSLQIAFITCLVVTIFFGVLSIYKFYSFNLEYNWLLFLLS